MIDLRDLIVEKLIINKDIKSAYADMFTQNPKKSNRLLDNDNLNKSFCSESKDANKDLTFKKLTDDIIKSKNNGELTVLQFEHNTHKLIQQYDLEVVYHRIDNEDNGYHADLLTVTSNKCKPYKGSEFYLFSSSFEDSYYNNYGEHVVECLKVIKDGIYIQVYGKDNVKPFITWFETAYTEDRNDKYSFNVDELLTIENKFNNEFRDIYYTFRTTTSVIIKGQKNSKKYASITKEGPNKYVGRINKDNGNMSLMYGPLKTIEEIVDKLIDRIKYNIYDLDFDIKNHDI